MIIRARCILPMGGTPIENGALWIESGRVKWLGDWRGLEPPPGQKPIDLGEVVLMPGLINAHCHLDYTRMAGQIPPPKLFPDWVKTILSFKAHWSFSEFAESWLQGARMLIEQGTTTVADIESVPELLPEVWKSSPVRVVSFLEMTGVKSQRPANQILDETLDWIDQLPKIEGKQAALSPHALYSTTPDLMQRCGMAARDRNLLLSTHLAESESEFRMFMDGSGPFYDWLKSQRSMADCAKGSPIQLAGEYGLLTNNCIAVHVNYLVSGDAELLAEAGTSVVHCPRSHDYFGHDPFPFETLRSAGVNVCLGTDSLASSRKIGGKEPVLNLWDEMRLFAKYYSGVSPKSILDMCTTNGAKALGKPEEIGVLKPGAYADCITAAYSGPIQEARICEELLYTGEVREVFIAGELVRPASAG